MRFSSQLGSWNNGCHPSRQPVARQRRTSQLRLEQLEDRALPSFGFGWAFNVGGSSVDGCKSIATDGHGSIFVTGYVSTSTDGPINFDPQNTNPNNPNNTLPSTGGGYAAKYLADGTFQWVTSLASPGGGVTVQGAYVYVTNGSDVSKLDASTGVVANGWPVALPDGSSIAVGPSTGNVYVTGSNSSQPFVTKLDASGVIQWTRTTGGGTAEGNGVAVYDAPNNGPESVYVTGAYSGTTTFGTTSLKSLGGTDLFVSKLDSSGSTAWAGSMGTKNDDAGNGIVVDSSGNAYVTGYEGSSILVAKLAPSVGGSLVQSWAKLFSGKGNAPSIQGFILGRAVAVDANANVYTTGWFVGSVNFNPSGKYTLTSAGGTDGFVSKLDTNGNFIAAAALGGTLYDYPAAITVDNTSPGTPNVYITGSFRGTADFDPTTGTYYLTVDNTAGDYNPDLFVSKWTQSASSLRATHDYTALTDAANEDQALASLLVPEHIMDTASFVTGVGAGGQTEILPISANLLGTALHGVTAIATPQSVLSHSSSAAAVDWLFADLIGGSQANALAAESLLAPSA